MFNAAFAIGYAARGYCSTDPETLLYTTINFGTLRLQQAAQIPINGTLAPPSATYSRSGLSPASNLHGSC